MTATPLPHRRRAWLLGVVVPVLITAGTWAVVLPLVPRLPEVVALHWGPGGVDRTGSAGELLTTAGVISGVSLLVMAVLAVRTGRDAVNRRMVFGLAVGMATLFAAVTLGSVLVQVDATTAADAGSPTGWVAVGVLLATLAGAGAAVLAGRDAPAPSTTPVPVDAPRTELRGDERAVWLRGVDAMPEPLLWVVVVLGLLAAVGSALLTGDPIPVVIGVPVVALALVMTRWQVRVDARGLTAAGVLGWPRLQVPAAEIEEARVVQVRPFAEYGGWGLRTNRSGVVGVVIRKGEAIHVARSGGRATVVTVDDAATGAALLNTYADRARTAPSRSEA